MPTITVRLLVPDGMTGEQLKIILEEDGFAVGKPIVTELADVPPSYPLDDDDEVDLRPDEEDDLPSEDPART